MSLREFLVEAKTNTYASNGEFGETILTDGSKEFLFDKDNFKYRDSVFKRGKARKYIVTRVCLKLLKDGELSTSYKDVQNYSEKNNISFTLETLRQAIGKIRSNKFPNLKEFGTAGSFFKNPVISDKEALDLQKEITDLHVFTADNGNKKLSIAWVLDNQLGLNGFKDGNICLFKNQPLVVVNLGGASAREIKNFTDDVAQRIFDKIKIKIIPEVIFVGKF